MFIWVKSCYIDLNFYFVPFSFCWRLHLCVCRLTCSIQYMYVKAFVWKEVKQRGNRSVSVELVPLSPRLLLFVHLEMSPAPGLPRKRAKSLSPTIVFPIYWLNCRRDSTLFTRTCGHRESLRAGSLFRTKRRRGYWLATTLGRLWQR